MATSLLLMATDQPPTQETPRSLLIGPDETKPETAKQRGRKATRGQTQKKQPQRGMGVAQLERLRLHERWKKMTEGNPIQSLNLPNQLQYQSVQTPSPFSDLLSGVPVHHGAGSNSGQSLITGGSGGFVGLDRAMVVQRLGNGGLNGLVYGGVGGFGSGLGGLVCEQVVVDPYRVGAPDPWVQVGGVFETSKELSSMPKTQCVSDRCDVCFKKKRFINGENPGFNGGRNKLPETLPINGCDFLRMNLQNNSIFNGEMSDFSMKAATSAGYASRNVDEGVEVLAIHRKGKGNSVGGNVFMEYEFFPGKSGRSTCSKDLEFASEGSVAEGGEASYITNSTYSANASKSIDLSLKLSY